MQGLLSTEALQKLCVVFVIFRKTDLFGLEGKIIVTNSGNSLTYATGQELFE
jgi:hypothetical protein